MQRKQQKQQPRQAAENTDAYKDEDMSAYKVDGMSIGVSFGQNVHPFFKAMQKGIEDACADYGIEKISHSVCRIALLKSR